MSSFIRTSVGFLNLQHILLIRVGIEKEEGEDLVQMSDGRNIQCLIHDRDFLPQPKPETGTTPENRSMPMPPAIERPKETPSPETGEGVS
jgi:hypothetical protein